MRSLVLIVCLLISATGCRSLPKGPATTEGGVLFHIQSGPREPERVCMALMMATIMSEDREVCVYFDIEGVQLVVRGARDITHGRLPGTRSSLRTLADRGVPLVVNPGSLAALGRTDKELLMGVTLATRTSLLDFTGGRILTLDY